MNLRRLVSLAVLALGVTLAIPPSAAFAQDAKAMSEARAKFQKAVELERAQNWGAALKIFREVGQVKMSTQVRYHIATCEENLGQLVTALGGYELSLAQAEEEGAPEEFLAELRGAVEALRARIPKVVITRGEGAEAASIELDEVALGESQLGVDIPLDPGPHTLVATSPGFERLRQTISVQERESRTIVVALTPLVTDAPPKAEPVVAPPPVAEPAVDGGYGFWPYALGGAGAATLVVGVILLPVSQGKSADVRAICGGNDCSDLTSADDFDRARALAADARSLETIGWIATGVGAGLLGAGVTLFLLEPKKEVAPGVAIVPTALRADAGLSLRYAF